MTDRPFKPLGIKNYGHIPHLPGSRMGPGDHHCDAGQARIATEALRDRHDLVVVPEKLDGSNVGVARLNGTVYPLGRSGHLAASSPYAQHQLFAAWVYENQDRFLVALGDGERLCGEWLAQAHGTRYELRHEPVVDFLAKYVRPDKIDGCYLRTWAHTHERYENLLTEWDRHGKGGVYLIDVSEPSEKGIHFVFSDTRALKTVRFRSFMNDCRAAERPMNELNRAVEKEKAEVISFVRAEHDELQRTFDPSVVRLRKRRTILVHKDAFDDVE